MTETTEASPSNETPKPRKIAVLGSAVSSVALAPFGDPSWEIWACSPANKAIPRCDVWFELHNPDVKIREGLTEWLAWLRQQPSVYMQKASPDFPNAKEYPLREMVAKYGRYWWTSQIAYMLALAIEQKPQAIGLYGIDMAANSEYNQQRLACQFFMQEIARQGIDLVIPPESDILEPAPLYGYQESSRRWRKFQARKIELNDRIARLDQDIKAKDNEKRHLIGALDDMDYHMAHWANTWDFNT